jgi:hypothetical protein
MIAPSVLRTLEGRALEGWKGAVHPLDAHELGAGVRWFRSVRFTQDYESC